MSTPGQIFLPWPHYYTILLQSDVAPTVVEYLPAEQRRHAETPRVAEYVHAEQLRHVGFDVALHTPILYIPAARFVFIFFFTSCDGCVRARFCADQAKFDMLVLVCLQEITSVPVPLFLVESWLMSWSPWTFVGRSRS
jgi:hypothetical protein